MGNFFAQTEILPLFERVPSMSTKEITQKYHKFECLHDGFGWGVHFELYSKLFQHKKEAAQIEWRVWDDDENGVTDVLEILSAYLICSRGPFAVKVKALFSLFDFDENGTLSEDEMMILIRTAVSGLCKILGLTGPSVDALNQVGAKCFAQADVDPDGTITRMEFLDWVSTTSSCVKMLCKYGTMDKEKTLKAFADHNERHLAAKKIQREHRKRQKEMNEKLEQLQQSRQKKKGKANKPSYRLKDLKEAKRVFDSIDTDGSGEISVAELADVLKSRNTLSAQFSDEFMKILDNNQDGMIVFSEILQVLYPEARDQDIARMIREVSPPVLTEQTINELGHFFLGHTIDEANSVCLLHEIIHNCKDHPVYRRYVRDLEASVCRSSEKVDYQRFLKICFYKTHKRQLPEIFGWSTTSDLRALTESQTAELRDLFKLYDKENRGVISTADMKKQLAENEATGVEDLVKNLDLNGDHVISFCEFVRFYRAVWDEDAANKEMYSPRHGRQSDSPGRRGSFSFNQTSPSSRKRPIKS